MKKQQNYHETILSQVTYNEILTGNIFETHPFDKYKSSIIQCANGSIFSVFEIKAATSNLSIEEDANKRDIVLPFFNELENDFQIEFDIRRIKEPFEYNIPSNNLTGSINIIENRRQKEFNSNNNLVNKTYIILILKSKSKGLLITTDYLQKFIDKLENLISTFTTAGCKLNLLKQQELFEFLKYDYDFSHEKIKDFNINNTISTSLITYNYELKNIPLLIYKEQNLCSQCFTFSALPSYTYADMFNILTTFPYELHAVFKYKANSIEKSKYIVRHKKKEYKNSIFSLTSYIKKEVTSSDISDEYNHDAIDGKNQCDEILSQISNTGVSTGNIEITFCLYAEEEELKNNTKHFKNTMQKAGYLLKAEKLGNTLAFLSMLPASSLEYNSFLALSKNYCDFLHLGSPTQGAIHSILLQEKTNSDIPLCYGKNLDGSLYYFSLSGKVGKKGHTFITGPTGSGKSVFLSLLAASFLKYDNTRCVVIDRDLSSLELVLDNNGKIFYPLFDKTCFCPLYDAQNKKAEVIEFLKSLAFISGVEWKAEFIQDIYTILDLLDDKEGYNTITTFYTLLKGLNNQNPILNALLPFIKGGEFEGLFDNTEDLFDINNHLTLIETNKIFKNSNKSNDISIPFFIYIFNKLNNLFSDCVPTLLIIDEGWKILKHKMFSKYIEEWIKTLRKKNVDVVFSCTNISDIVSTHIAETIISNTETKIFFKDDNSTNEIEKQNYLKLGTNEHIINLIKNIPQFTPLILQENEIAIVDFKINSTLSYLNTTNQKRAKFLCEE